MEFNINSLILNKQIIMNKISSNYHPRNISPLLKPKNRYFLESSYQNLYPKKYKI